MITIDILQHAFYYAGLGWLVFPLHSVINGKCSCNNPKCTGKNRGKKRQRNVSETPPDTDTESDTDLKLIVVVWEKEFGLPISPSSADKLLVWVKQDGMAVELVE